MVRATRESSRCSVIVVSRVLLLQALRTLISIVILIVGAVVFGCNPADFTTFSFCALPGTTVIAGGLFLIGASLWIG
jgi:hypothetical protein